MQFRVTKPLKGTDTSVIPETLRHVPELQESDTKGKYSLQPFFISKYHA